MNLSEVIQQLSKIYNDFGELPFKVAKYNYDVNEIVTTDVQPSNFAITASGVVVYID